VPKDTRRTATTDHAQLQPPEQVTLAVAELAGAEEGLLAPPRADSAFPQQHGGVRPAD
jgi:hypothetical protein